MREDNHSRPSRGKGKGNRHRRARRHTTLTCRSLCRRTPPVQGGRRGTAFRECLEQDRRPSDNVPRNAESLPGHGRPPRTPGHMTTGCVRSRNGDAGTYHAGSNAILLSESNLGTSTTVRHPRRSPPSRKSREEGE